MADHFKIDGDGHCKTCNKVPTSGEIVQCYSCTECVHVICNGASSADERVATKTMITGFLLPSTKRNFMFYCDVCLTKMEISKSETDSKRVDILEDKMNGIDKQPIQTKRRSLKQRRKRGNPLYPETIYGLAQND